MHTEDERCDSSNEKMKTLQQAGCMLGRLSPIAPLRMMGVWAVSPVARGSWQAPFKPGRVLGPWDTLQSSVKSCGNWIIGCSLIESIVPCLQAAITRRLHVYSVNATIAGQAKSLISGPGESSERGLIGCITSNVSPQLLLSRSMPIVHRNMRLEEVR